MDGVHFKLDPVHFKFGQVSNFFGCPICTWTLSYSPQLPHGPKEESLDAQTDTAFYQWVPFMFLLNGLIFLIPKTIWHGIVDGGKNFVENFTIDEADDTYVSKYITKDDTDADKPK